MLRTGDPNFDEWSFAREVAAEDALWRELGVRCRSTEETLADMAAVLVK